jgi:hypothetical protein
LFIVWHVEFEWDGAKSASNKAKHGIGFDEATALWEDSGLVILPSRYPDEERFLDIGAIGSVFWTAIFTERSERIRLISVRHARAAERQIYERNQ